MFTHQDTPHQARSSSSESGSISRGRGTRNPHCGVAALLLSAILGSPTAQAQVQNSEKPPEANEERLEKTVVTGSRIKRIDMEGPNPIVSIDREAIEQSGVSSVEGVLRGLSENSVGSFKGTAGNGGSYGGAAFLNLRGLGSGRTLILLDGRRVPGLSGGAASNLTNLPLAAVERVEVMKGGGAAVYGSDAIGGVVNIITRKDFEGLSATIYNSKTELGGGNEQTVDLVYGAASDKARSVTVLSFKHTDGLGFNQRTFFREGNLSRTGNPGSWRALERTDEQGNVIPVSPYFADARCPADRVDTSGGNEFCLLDYTDYIQKNSRQDLISLYQNFEYDVSNDVTLFGRIGVTRRQDLRIFPPAPDQYTIGNQRALDLLGEDNLAKLGDGQDPLNGRDVLLNYRTLSLGNRISRLKEDSYGLSVGARGYLSDTWEWEINTSKFRTEGLVINENGFASRSGIQRLIDGQLVIGQNPDGSNQFASFNPFTGEGEENLDLVRVSPFSKTIDTQTQADVVFTGELGDIGGGPVGASVGLSFQESTYETSADSQTLGGDVIAKTSSEGGGSRVSRAIFAELALPVLTDLEFNVAARYDMYSDFGNAFTPQANMRWTPSDILMIRGGYARGFKAPDLAELYRSSSISYPRIKDEVYCATVRETPGSSQEDIDEACSLQQVKTTFVNNLDLKEEVSDQFYLGFVVEPLKDLSFGLEYWRVELDNVVSLDLDAITEVLRDNPDLAESLGVVFERNSRQELTSITASSQNLGERRVQGLDFKLDYSQRFGSSRLQWSTKASYLLDYTSREYPGGAKVYLLGKNTYPRLRINNSLMATIGEHQGILSSSTISSHEKVVADKGNIAAFTSFDTQYTYNTPWDLKVTLGINNLLNSFPTEDESAGAGNSIDQDLYSIQGRTFYTKLSMTL